MSTGSQSHRGRRAVVRRSGSSTLLWVIGALVLLGSALLVFLALRGTFSGDTIDSGEFKTVTAQNGTLSAPLTYKNAQGQDITVAQGMHYIGNPDAPVKVIEYADFQCPGCANFNKTMEAGVFKDFVDNGKIQFIYHEFPLSQHANAQISAQAARCAGDQDKFWQMHDVLFHRQDQWADDGNPVARFMTYATGLGMDRTAFQNCINNGTYAPQVKAAVDASAFAKIPATPTFVVNGKQVASNDLRDAIIAALSGK